MSNETTTLEKPITVREYHTTIAGRIAVFEQAYATGDYGAAWQTLAGNIPLHQAFINRRSVAAEGPALTPAVPTPVESLAAAPIVSTPDKLQSLALPALPTFAMHEADHSDKTPLQVTETTKALPGRTV